MNSYLWLIVTIYIPNIVHVHNIRYFIKIPILTIPIPILKTSLNTYNNTNTYNQSPLYKVTKPETNNIQKFVTINKNKNKLSVKIRFKNDIWSFSIEPFSEQFIFGVAYTATAR